MVALELLYGRQAMSDAERRVWLETYCDDLGAYTDEEIANACRRYRQDGENKYFPTPGALLALMKNPYADPPSANRYTQLHGGGCRCARCVNKVPSEGFFRAPPEDYARDDATRKELAYDNERRTLTTRLDEAEMHRRFLMTQELVRDHGWEWEAARRRVMVERTRALYPEYTIWPEIGTEST